MATARQGAAGVIYPDLLRLTRLNSHPINADRYRIGWEGLLGPSRKGIGRCALPPQLDRGPCARYRGLLDAVPGLAKPPSTG